jgi:drug/metabolite transporter (DMT)-like permease
MVSTRRDRIVGSLVAVGEGALIAYIMPIWAMLFAWPFLHVRPTIRDVAALVLGVAGVALLLIGNGFAFGAGKLLGMALALSCAVLFALGNVLNRKPLLMPPLVVVAWQVGLGCLAMLIIGVVFERPDIAAITPLGVGCFVYMTLIPMGVCYLTWFETLRRLPPTSASTGMLLVPVIGVISAAIILGEPLGLREIAAMVLTLGGVTLALQKA